MLKLRDFVSTKELGKSITKVIKMMSIDKLCSSFTININNSVRYTLYKENLVLIKLLRKYYPNNCRFLHDHSERGVYLHNMIGYIDEGLYPIILDNSTILIVRYEIKSASTEKKFTPDTYTTVSYMVYGLNHSKWISKIRNWHNNQIDMIINLMREKKFSFMLIDVIDRNGEIQSGGHGAKIQYNIIDNIIFDGKQDLLRKIDIFTNSKNIYEKTATPYRLGILLYGKPGTGKTSIAKLIAAYLHTNLHIISGTSVEQMHAIEGGNVILIEELDLELAQLPSNTNEESAVTIITHRLKTLLTSIDAIDGGNILIATTNHIENIPEPLIRDGRFDIKICMNYFTRKESIQMIESFDMNPEEVIPEIEGDIDNICPATLQKQLREIQSRKLYQEEEN